MQKCAFPGLPVFVAPDDLPSLLRKTRRTEKLVIHVMSLAVIADKEKDFRSFMKSAYDMGASIKTSEDEGAVWPTRGMDVAVSAWRMARKEGSGKAGGRISADRKKAKVKEAADKIKDKWPLPSKEWPTKALLEEAGVSLNAIKSVLGKRPIAQYNYQAKLKRKANAKR